MNGFIEQRIQGLNINRTSSSAALGCGAAFFLGLGVLILIPLIDISLEAGKLEVGGLVVTLAFLIPGIACVRVMVKRKKKKRAALEQPYIYVELYGSGQSVEAEVRAFNEEYAQGKIRYAQASMKGEWLTESYVLVDTGLGLQLGRLSDIVWAHYGETITGYDKQRYKTVGYELFFGQPNAVGKRVVYLSAYNGLSQAMQGLGFPISEDNKLRALAWDNWDEFCRLHGENTGNNEEGAEHAGGQHPSTRGHHGSD